MRNLERASCLTGVPALPTALSSALAMALWLVAFNAASSCHAQRINPSQAAFLKDSQTAWETRLPGWAVGVKCIVAKGISCDAKGMITELGLSYSGIVGSIPDSISALVALTDLYLSGNSLTGSIPDSISALTNLKDLSLHSNSLNGSIPDSISALTALTGLDLHSNSLNGSIPDSISVLANLWSLDLSTNSLTGSIPDSISALTALTVLDLHSNSLNGSIPDSISALTALTRLRPKSVNKDLSLSSRHVQLTHPHTGISALILSRAPFPTASPHSRHSQGCKRRTRFAPPACCSVHWVLHAMCASLLALFLCPCTLHAHSFPPLLSASLHHAVFLPFVVVIRSYALPAKVRKQGFEPLVSSRLTHSPPYRDLSTNSLTGSIPDIISALENLQDL
ncbi:unnamed protein product [Closterium sp. NIES-53]